MQSGRQAMAICDESGLIAVANGRVVELYQADAITMPGLQTDDNDRLATDPVSVNPHLPFAGEIALSDLIYGLEDAPTYATSVYFPAPDVLFVATTTIPNAASSPTTSSSNPSTRLSGFRLFPRRVGAESRRKTSDRQEAPFSIFLLFSDAFAGVAPIAIMEPVARSSFTHSDQGAVVVLFDQDSNSQVQASSFGVFQWSERYSNRELSVTTPLQATASALTVVAVSDDAQWAAIGDASGSLSVLDFRGFVWDLEVKSAEPRGIQEGRRLPLGLRFRMGHAMPHAAAAATRHPLDAVRVACQTRVGTANSIASSLRWWTAKFDGENRRTSRYLLAGQQDGALAIMALVRGKEERSSTFTLKTTEIYPPLRALKNDAVVCISEPTLDLISQAFTFSVVSTSSWRRWTIKQVSREDEVKRRIVWPTLSDSLGLPTHQFERQQIFGLGVVRASDRIGVRLSDVVAELHDSPRRLEWLLLLGRDGIRAVAHKVNELHHTKESCPPKPRDFTVQEKENDKSNQTQPQSASISAASDVDTLQSRSTKVAKPADNRGYQPKKVDHATDHPVAAQRDTAKGGRANPSDDQAETKADPSNPYKLPPMSHSGHLPVASQEEPVRPLTKDQYNKRLATMAQRVEIMSTSLHSLRRSFQLFTDDVKDHMAFISMQLEQLHERAKNESNSA